MPQYQHFLYVDPDVELNNSCIVCLASDCRPARCPWRFFGRAGVRAISGSRGSMPCRGRKSVAGRPQHGEYCSVRGHLTKSLSQGGHHGGRPDHSTVARQEPARRIEASIPGQRRSAASAGKEAVAQEMTRAGGHHLAAGESVCVVTAVHHGTVARSPTQPGNPGVSRVHQR